MKMAVLKRLACLAVAVGLCFALTACSESASEVVESEAESDPTVYAVSGGNISVPEGFALSEESNTITTLYADGTISGGVTLTSYRTSKYFTAGQSSLSVVVNMTLTDTEGVAAETSYTDATIALWKQGTDEAVYLGTVHFAADGTTQTATFSGIESGANYRVAFAYGDSARYRMSGTFNINGVTEESAEEDVEPVAGA